MTVVVDAWLELRETLLLPAGNFLTASAFIGSMIKPGGFERQMKLRVGNCQTDLITSLLKSRYHVIRQFIQSEAESLLVLVLERPQA